MAKKDVFYIIDILNSENVDNTKEYSIDEAVSFAKELISIERNTPDVDSSALCKYNVNDVDAENVSMVLSHFNYYITKQGNTKYEIWVYAKNAEEKVQVATAIHEQLVGNPDYRDNNIIVNMDEPLTVKVWFGEECEIIPDIKIPEHVNDEVSSESVHYYRVMDRANPHAEINDKVYTPEEIIAYANSFVENDRNSTAPAVATNIDEADSVLDYYNRTMYYESEVDFIITVQTTNKEIRQHVVDCWLEQLKDNSDFMGCDNIILDSSIQDGVYLISTSACAKFPEIIVPGTN